MQVPQLTTDIIALAAFYRRKSRHKLHFNVGISNTANTWDEQPFFATNTNVRVFFTLEGGSCKRSMHIAQ